MRPSSRSQAGPPGKVEYALSSPVTGGALGQVLLSDAEALRAAIEEADACPGGWDESEVLAFLKRLEACLRANRERLLEVTLLETGFPLASCHEIVDGAIEYLRDFEHHVRGEDRPPRRVPHSYGPTSQREMAILQRPYRWVAAMVPQNAALALSLTIVASALYAGARVLLRPSLQCGLSGELLAQLVAQSQPLEGTILIRNSLAKEFVAACLDSQQVELLHYIGSNRHALSVFVEAFKAKKVCLLDGQGNGLLYVDEDYPIDEAARLIVSGATRYNGETCTSVNGVLAHERIYPALRDSLVEEVRALRVGDPRDPSTQVGPLFSFKQAAELADALREGSGRVLCGGTAFGAYFVPAIVEAVALDSALVREGVFGPAFWLQSIREEALPEWLRANQFPLSDTVLSHRKGLVDAVARCSRAGRICVNADPSIESMFEPWGGYPPSGMNPVSVWIDKYRQTYQLDVPLDASASVDGKPPC